MLWTLPGFLVFALFMAIRLTWVQLSRFPLYNTNLQNTESKTHPRIWFRKCFLGFWEVFSYSWRNLGVCLDSGKCFATLKLSCLFLVNWKDCLENYQLSTEIFWLTYSAFEMIRFTLFYSKYVSINFSCYPVSSFRIRLYIHIYCFI